MDRCKMGYSNVMTRQMTDLIDGSAAAYTYCGHDECDLGVNGDGKVMCSGNYCADKGGWDPPVDAWWGSEEDYPR